MMWGQTRYLDYEVSPGCSDCSNVFPQGMDLLRLHDSQCSYADIAIAPGAYNWEVLDRHLESCEARGIPVLYCFCYVPEWAYDQSYTPQWPDPGIRSPHSNWPPNLDYFEEFVRALIGHCTRPDGSCRIQYFEAWNEVNALAFWNGTDAILFDQQQMLWRVIHELAPGSLLTTPTPTKNMTSVEWCIDSFLQQGFQEYSHIVSFHGYWDKGSPAAAIEPTLQAIADVMLDNNCNHPLWDTEWGWTQGYPDDGSIPLSDVPQWIKEALAVRLENGISAAIWFQWDSPNRCGNCLADPVWKGRINEAGGAWVDCYSLIHPLPPVTDLERV